MASRIKCFLLRSCFCELMRIYCYGFGSELAQRINTFKRALKGQMSVQNHQPCDLRIVVIEHPFMY